MNFSRKNRLCSYLKVLLLTNSASNLSLQLAQGLSAVEDLSAVADQTDPNVLHVSWTYPTNSQCSAITGYMVEYELISHDQCGTIFSTNKQPYGIVETTSVTLDSLEAFSTYRVYVTPLSVLHTGPETVVTGTTAEGGE